jgi:hypothetical protein
MWRTILLIEIAQAALADEAPGVGVHQLYQLLEVERRLDTGIAPR